MLSRLMIKMLRNLKRKLKLPLFSLLNNKKKRKRLKPLLQPPLLLKLKKKN